MLITTLSIHIWKIKEKGNKYNIKGNMATKIFSLFSKICKLNIRKDIFTKYRHTNKDILGNP